jgi:hypothetical protein
MDSGAFFPEPSGAVDTSNASRESYLSETTLYLVQIIYRWLPEVLMPKTCHDLKAKFVHAFSFRSFGYIKQVIAQVKRDSVSQLA